MYYFTCIFYILSPEYFYLFIFNLNIYILLFLVNQHTSLNLKHPILKHTKQHLKNLPFSKRFLHSGKLNTPEAPLETFSKSHSFTSTGRPFHKVGFGVEREHVWFDARWPEDHNWHQKTFGRRWAFRYVTPRLLRALKFITITLN